MSVPSWAITGAAVECVSDATSWAASVSLWERLRHWRKPRPKCGRVYFIKEVHVDPEGVFLGINGFWLLFAVEHFRPLVNDDTEAQLYHEAKKHGKLKAPARPEIVDA